MKYYHAMDVSGRHRLGRSKYAANAANKECDITWGEWAPYSAPAKLGQLIVVTDYYEGSVEFPDPTLLYKVIPDAWPLIKMYDGGSDGV